MVVPYAYTLPWQQGIAIMGVVIMGFGFLLHLIGNR